VCKISTPKSTRELEFYENLYLNGWMAFWDGILVEFGGIGKGNNNF
jgi:hypothetical protein